MAPIIIPEGEKVGDIIDVTNATLIADANDCFPSLKPRETSSQLPAIEIASEKELATTLGVAASAEASGGARSGRTFSLDFQDVKVERVSLFQLRNALMGQSAIQFVHLLTQLIPLRRPSLKSRRLITY